MRSDVAIGGGLALVALLRVRKKSLAERAASGDFDETFQGSGGEPAPDQSWLNSWSRLALAHRWAYCDLRGVWDEPDPVNVTRRIPKIYGADADEVLEHWSRISSAFEESYRHFSKTIGAIQEDFFRRTGAPPLLGGAQGRFGEWGTGQALLTQEEGVRFWNAVERAAIEVQALQAYQPTDNELAAEWVMGRLERLPRTVAQAAVSAVKWGGTLAVKTAFGILGALLQEPLFVLGGALLAKHYLEKR